MIDCCYSLLIIPNFWKVFVRLHFISFGYYSSDLTWILVFYQWPLIFLVWILYEAEISSFELFNLFVLLKELVQYLFDEIAARIPIERRIFLEYYSAASIFHACPLILKNLCLETHGTLRSREIPASPMHLPEPLL